jgi:hypothetical protein
MRPCNCPNKYKVNGKCAYSSDKSSCCTAGKIYKITRKAQNCNCVYIGKSQRYVKMRVQEHIGEATKIYSKHVLLTNRNQTTTPPSPSSQTSSSCLALLSWPALSYDSIVSQPLCVVINPLTHTPPTGLTMQLHSGRSQSDKSMTTNIEYLLPNILTTTHLPTVNFGPPIEAAPPH